DPSSGTLRSQRTRILRSSTPALSRSESVLTAMGWTPPGVLVWGMCCGPGPGARSTFPGRARRRLLCARRARGTSERLADHADQTGETVGVAPLVVVPGGELARAVDGLGQRGVED